MIIRLVSLNNITTWKNQLIHSNVSHGELVKEAPITEQDQIIWNERLCWVFLGNCGKVSNDFGWASLTCLANILIMSELLENAKMPETAKKK